MDQVRADPGDHFEGTVSEAVSFKHRYGVSVVIPAYRGPDALAGTLRSLDEQTLAPERFEVVVVVNGPAAAERSSFEALRSRFDRLTIRLLATETAGASFAWNVGVQSARMEWLTFVDDDDTVSARFLESLLEVAEPGVMPLTEIHDVGPDGTIDKSSPLNRRIRREAGTTVPGERLPQAMGFNASKLVPTMWAKTCRYDPGLSNGQDVAYFGSLSLQHDIAFAVPAVSGDAAYRRTLSPISMSRQEMSYDFSIEQRLDVVKTLDRARRRAQRRRQRVTTHLIEAQVHLMNRYLQIHRDRHGDVLASIRSRALREFPYGALNRGLSSRLVVTPLTIDSWMRVDEWAHTWDDPFDVLVVVGAETTGDFPIHQAPTRSELAGRTIRVEASLSHDDVNPLTDLTERAVAAVEGQNAPVWPYREVVSAPHPTARAISSELGRRHPSMQHVMGCDGDRDSPEDLA